MNDERWQSLQDMAFAMAFAFRQAAPPPPLASSTRGPKPRAPDIFDGTDHSKLRDFLFQCTLVFDHDRNAYPTDTHRIRYAIQHLSKSAQRHFRHAYEKPTDLQPDYMRRWDSFESELHLSFGDPDTVEAAVTRLRALKMKETHRAAVYRVHFDELASETDWDSRALYSQYYQGLAERIKDVLATVTKPTSLQDLKELSITIDNRYWARENEKKGYRPKTTSDTTTSNSSSSRSSAPTISGSTPTSSNRQQPFNNRASSTAPSTTSNQTRQSNTTSRPSGTNNTNNTNRSTPRPNLDNKLDENGRLLPSERQRRIDNGLCLYCGKKGHMASECPSQKQKDTRARRANANTSHPPPPPPSAPAAEPAALAEAK
jgi:hypothetical protein